MEEKIVQFPENPAPRPKNHKKKPPRRGRLWLFFVFVLAVGLIWFSRHSGGEEFAVPEQIIICLDAGHGGADAGAVNGDRLEKDDNLRIVQAVRDRLLDFGSPRLEVFLTRQDDTALELQERVDLANDGNATLFLSVHRNSGGGKGVEVWTSAAAEKDECRLAAYIMDGLESVGVSKVRGVRHGTAGNPAVSYTVLGRTTMPACLLELGFLDSETDNTLLDEQFDAYAQAIADGILQMVKLK